MRKVFFLFVLTVFSLEYSYSQVIKLENGVSLSWTNHASQANIGYSGGLSLDYLEKNHFMLHSKLGFLKRSETSTMEYFSQNEMNITINYLSFATTIRFKQPIGKGYFFVGLGPSIDFKLNSKFKMEGRAADNVQKSGDFHSQDVVASILSECGYFIDIRNWRMELDVAYRNNLTKINMETRKGFISHILTCSIGIGYKFHL